MFKPNTTLSGGLFLMLTGVCSAALLCVSSAQAANTDAQASFSGLIPESCTVNVMTPGMLGVSTDQATLSSEESGGVAATAAIVSNSLSSSIQVLPPIAFSVAPAGSATDTVFGTKYRLTGVTTATVPDGTTLNTLGMGASTMTIDASAVKSSGTFTGGAYSFLATVRCVTP